MLRVPAVLFVLLLVGCDSGEGDSDSSLLSIAVETPSGSPVEGLALSMEYALVGTNDDDDGDRSAQPAGLSYFEIFTLGGERFRVEWATDDEEGVARFVVEATPIDEDFEEVAEAAPHGPVERYAVEVEGRFDSFRLRIEYTDGSVEFSEVISPEPGASPAEVALHTGYPNPFSTVMTLAFTLSDPATTGLEVLDLEGRPAIQRSGLPPGHLLRESRSPGQYSVAWEASADLIGGFYRIRLTAGEDTATVLAVYTGQDADVPTDRRRIVTALGQTDAQGRFATDDRARFPQRHAGVETEYRDENNVYLGDIQPSNEIVLVLRDGAGREQRYERTLTGGSNRFELTWSPE